VLGKELRIQKDSIIGPHILALHFQHHAISY
jgi:hypothetical protein